MATEVRVPLSEVIWAERLNVACIQCGAKEGELCRNISREPVGEIRAESHFYRGATSRHKPTPEEALASD